MARVHPERVRSTSKALWKTVADELRQVNPKIRETDEYKNIKLILYPDDKVIEYWGGILFILLVYTCTITPYRICLVDNDSTAWLYTDFVIDILFFLDFLINLFLAYYDKEMTLVTSHRKIFINYLKGWMIIDFLSCIPLQFALETQKNYSFLLRFSRVSKLYKLIKIFRLIRIVKLVKGKNRIMKYMTSLFRMHIAIERVLWFLITFLLLVHLLACLWIFIARIDSINSDQNWIFNNKFQDYDDVELYLTSVYWATTTLTTVGYGDIHAYNNSERVFACFSMIIGIFLYSYIIGAITNLLSNMDLREAKLARKLDIVNRLHREYPNIDKELYKKLTIALEYKHKNSKSDIDSLLNDLPLSLKSRLLIVIYQKELQGNKFFESKRMDFVAYIAPLLKPVRIEEGDYVFKAQELACEMYFILSGEIEMTIFTESKLEENATLTSAPEISEVAFNTLLSEYYFGETDLLFTENHERTYNARASRKSELLALSNSGFEDMLKMFEEEGKEIIKLAQERNQRLKEKQAEALDVFHKSKAVRRLVSLPLYEDTELTSLRATINIIPPQDNIVERSRNLYNTLADAFPGKVEGDIEWIKSRLRKLKVVVSETKENISKVYEALYVS